MVVVEQVFRFDVLRGFCVCTGYRVSSYQEMVILGIEKNILIPFLLLAEINKIQPNKWRIVKTKQKVIKQKKRFAIQIL